MKMQLKLEELAMLLLSLVLFSFSGASWWWYLGLFFVPDVSFAAYAVNSRVGAFFYNLLHHKGLALLIFGMGYYLKAEGAMLVGSVFFGHSSFDRILGYGLKYPDDFQHTHLGWIGKAGPSSPKVT